MPEPDLLALCEQLDGLRAAATPGPWVHGDNHYVTGDFTADGRYCTDLAHCPDKSDADLIVAAVNALPDLTAAVRGLLADRDTLARVAALADRWAGEGGRSLTYLADLRRALGGAS